MWRTVQHRREDRVGGPGGAEGRGGRSTMIVLGGDEGVGGI